MRHNSRRGKNRSNNGRSRGNVPPRMQVFDSNGPDVRIRGTAWQVHEKYLALAKDASASGDTIMAENYMQHAEHYQRIINTFAEQQGGNEKQWSPNRADNDDTSDEEVDGNMVETKRDDDLGLPSSLFKKGSAGAEQALESA